LEYWGENKMLHTFRQL